MLSIEFIASQCFGLELTSLPVVAALLSTKLENMSKIKVKSQINCSLVTHPTHSLSGSQIWSGVGFLSHLLSPSPPTAKSGLVGVPRSLDGVGIYYSQIYYLRSGDRKIEIPWGSLAVKLSPHAKFFIFYASTRSRSVRLAKSALWRDRQQINIRMSPPSGKLVD
jgi:hypothetical protein